MLYQAGKSRIGKRIAKVIQTVEHDLGYHNLPYIEPFVGMAGVLRHMNGVNNGVKSKRAKRVKPRKLTASDINKDVILLLKAVQSGKWKPVNACSKETWERYKHSETHSAKRAFIGIAGSWGGAFFQGYRLKYGNKDYLREANNSLKKLRPDLKGVKFSSKSYEKYENPRKRHIIYCDPPYKGNQLGNKNGLFQTFDHTKFWEKMRKWSRNNIVIISESTAPKDFKRIWTTQSHVSNSDRYKTKRYKDNLYVHKSTYARLDSGMLRRIRKI